MVLPWAEAGYQCYCVDIDQDVEPEDRQQHENIEYVEADLHKYLPPKAEYKAVFAFPPCTNVAVSGARWFKDKGLNGLASAAKNFERARQIIEWAEPDFWMIENPVSTMSTYWREPDHTFHPYEYDGYTEEDNRYKKTTCLWTSDTFRKPETDAVEDFDDRIHKMPPSEDRGRMRSKTPLGFARAVFQAHQQKPILAGVREKLGTEEDA